jgi:hypothetical protein
MSKVITHQSIKFLTILIFVCINSYQIIAVEIEKKVQLPTNVREILVKKSEEFNSISLVWKQQRTSSRERFPFVGDGHSFALSNYSAAAPKGQ